MVYLLHFYWEHSTFQTTVRDISNHVLDRRSLNILIQFSSPGTLEKYSNILQSQKGREKVRTRK